MEKKVVTWDFLNCPWQPKVVKGFSLFDIQQSPNRKILLDQKPTIFGYHNPRLIMHLRYQKMCCTALSAFKVGLIMLFPTFILLSFHVSDSCWRSPLIFELSPPLTRLPSIALVDLLWDSERSHRRHLPPCSWDGGFWVQLWEIGRATHESWCYAGILRLVAFVVAFEIAFEVAITKKLNCGVLLMHDQHHRPTES